MRILGPPSAAWDTVMKNIPLTAHYRFKKEMVTPSWDAAVKYGVDPVGAIAQMAKETNWGNFNGDDPQPHRVTWWFYNPAGLKIEQSGRWPETDGDEPFAHTIFPNWPTGCTAHIQHLIAYAGVPLPEGELNVDPRWRWVALRFSAPGAGLQNFSELGGPQRWAPNPNYGVEIETIMSRLRTA